jgi:superoxide dismutase, Fe-Mn family
VEPKKGFRRSHVPTQSDLLRISFGANLPSVKIPAPSPSSIIPGTTPDVLISRRTALQFTATAAAVSVMTPASLFAEAGLGGTYPHQLPSLPYSKDALEPHFDTQTMEIHHGKHHKAYVDKLNEALAEYPALQKQSVEELLRGLDKVPEKIRGAVRNHGGGHFNHSLFWQTLAPAGSGGKVSERLKTAFGELGTTADEIREVFLKVASGVFGSGWAWVTVTRSGQLKIESSPNQDVPFGPDKAPLLGLDVWEHAYYLKYQNRRADYVKAHGNVINWDFVNDRFEKLTK